MVLWICGKHNRILRFLSPFSGAVPPPRPLFGGQTESHNETMRRRRLTMRKRRAVSRQTGADGAHDTSKPTRKGGLFYTAKQEVAVVAKSKYDSLVAPRLDEIKDWCRNGATDLEVYTRLGVGKDAFYDYKKKFPEFAEVLKHSKEYCDGQIENALFEAAKAGNVTAQIFWLKNRRPKVWREKPEENDGEKTDGGVHININIADCKGGDGNGNGGE